MDSNLKKMIQALTLKSSEEISDENISSLVLLALMRWEKQNQEKAPPSSNQSFANEDEKSPNFYLSFNSPLFRADQFSDEALKDFFFSRCYAEGIGVDQSDIKAFKYLKKQRIKILTWPRITLVTIMHTE